MALSAYEHQTLQRIERAIITADPHLAARFAAFSGRQQQSATRLLGGTYLLAVGRRCVPVNRRWTAAALLGMVAGAVLLATGLTIGDLALVIAGVTAGAITVVTAGFALAACLGSARRRPPGG